MICLCKICIAKAPSRRNKPELLYIKKKPYLKVFLKRKLQDRQTEVSLPLVHFSDACNSQSWASMRLQTHTQFYLPQGGRDSSTCCLSGCVLAGSRGGAGTPTQAHKFGMRSSQAVSLLPQ